VITWALVARTSPERGFTARVPACADWDPQHVRGGQPRLGALQRFRVSDSSARLEEGSTSTADEEGRPRALRTSEAMELVSEITRLALSCDCRARFRSDALLAIGVHVPFSRGTWVEAPPFGELRTEISRGRGRSPERGGALPPGLLCLELKRFGTLRARLVLEREDRAFSADEVRTLAGLLPVLILADEGTGMASSGPARALSPRESEIVEYVRLGYTNAQIALATGRSVAAVRNLLVRIFDKTGVRSRAQLVGGQVTTKGLTRRESEVVQHLRGGLTNREIGRVLGISINTVRNTLARLFEKVGVSTRSELMGTLADQESSAA